MCAVRAQRKVRHAPSAGRAARPLAPQGSSNNKYLEIYNPTPIGVSLASYAFPSVSNAPTTAGEHEYWNVFDEGAAVPPNDVYVICHPDASAEILAHCNETHRVRARGPMVAGGARPAPRHPSPAVHAM